MIIIKTELVTNVRIYTIYNNMSQKANNIIQFVNNKYTVSRYKIYYPLCTYLIGKKFV